MSLRRLITITTLAVWVLLGPLAIAHGGCIGMGMTCASSCVLTPYALPTPTAPVVPQLVAYLQIAPSTYLPTPIVKVLKPPPRSVFFPASFSPFA
jgi:hypothetical protein